MDEQEAGPPEAPPETQPQTGTDGETGVLVGEYDEDASEDIDFRTEGATVAQHLPLTPEMQKMVEARLNVYVKLDELDQERSPLQEQEDLPDQAKSELQRQQREAQRLPTGESAQGQIQRLGKTLTNLSSKVKQGDAESMDPRLAESYRLAFRQWKLCVVRDELNERLLSVFAAAAEEEPLRRLLERHDIDAKALFGWAYYATALEATSTTHQERRKVLQMSLTGLQQKNRGLLNRLRRGNESEEEEQAKLEQTVERHARTISHLSRERASIEPVMVKEFWRVYTEAAPLILRSDLSEEEQRTLRLFLRYCAISTETWMLSPEVAEALRADVQDVIETTDYTMNASRVFYADEYIAFVARGAITPSVDEDLELNGRHTPPWHADRLHRRRIGTIFKETALKEMAARLRRVVEKLRKNREDLELSRDKLMRSAPDYKKRSNALGQQIQKCRVEAARYERAITRIEDEYLPAQLDTRLEAEEKLGELDFQITPDGLARKEAAALHRISRLTAKLKDPFPPFALRDNFSPGTEAVNDRATMLQELKEVERRDPVIFKEPLMQVKKISHRIYLRYCPVILLAPACGFIGYSWNPRSGNEVGRLALPVHMPRPGIRERMLHNMLADFRWDTSKASAGVDLLTSDTLVAAYSNVRWEYRRKQRETREKSAIYSEENDRQNFRRHYTLHLQSALDGGKKLFFKCPEVYDALLRYVLLPEGVEKLKKN